MGRGKRLEISLNFERLAAIGAVARRRFAIGTHGNTRFSVASDGSGAVHACGGCQPDALRQGGLADRQALSARRNRAGVVRCRSTGQNSGTGPATATADSSGGLLAAPRRPGTLDGATADGRGC